MEHREETVINPFKWWREIKFNRALKKYKDRHYCDVGRGFIEKMGKPTFNLGQLTWDCKTDEQKKAFQSLMSHQWQCEKCGGAVGESVYTLERQPR